MKDRGRFTGSHRSNAFSSYVFADDAEDIKAHRWFKSVPWDRLHTLSPPFIPQVDGAEDTHYFEESEPIEDWSESRGSSCDLTQEEVRELLSDFRPGVQNVAIELVAKPFDPTKLRSIQTSVSLMNTVSSEEKEILKAFVRLYGRKERKRPRDRLLRDDKTKDIVMDIRKKTAFMGYTWRRMRHRELVTTSWM